MEKKMSGVESFLRKNIFVDTDSIIYGQDQAYINYPVRFPTVTVKLENTDTLERLADDTRLKYNERPLNPIEGLSDYDENGWYDFYITLNDWSECRVDNCITFYPENVEDDGDGLPYSIDLSEDEQHVICFIIDEQLRRKTGMGILQHLKEAEKEVYGD